MEFTSSKPQAFHLFTSAIGDGLSWGSFAGLSGGYLCVSGHLNPQMGLNCLTGLHSCVCWSLLVTGGPTYLQRVALTSPHPDNDLMGCKWKLHRAPLAASAWKLHPSSLLSVGQSKSLGQLTFKGWGNRHHLLMERAINDLWPFKSVTCLNLIFLMNSKSSLLDKLVLIFPWFLKISVPQVERTNCLTCPWLRMSPLPCRPSRTCVVWFLFPLHPQSLGSSNPHTEHFF